MQVEQPIVKDLVFVGGGHTHAIVLRKFGMKPLPGVRLTLITNLVDTPYSGMLPCHISGLYDFDASHIDLRPLSRFAQCQLLMDSAVDIDVDNQRVICAHHPPVAYDVLSIDIGSTPATVDVPGAADLSIPAKPVPNLLKAWNQFLDEVRQSPPGPIAISVVGGGVGGVELTLNMQIRLWHLLDELGRSRQDLSIHLFHRGAEIANGRNRSTRRLLTRRFVERGIHLHLQESVCAVEATPENQRVVRCESGLKTVCARVFWVTNASAPSWIRNTGLATDEAGFMLVEDTLQSCSHPNIFAAGDVATMKHHFRPKAGVFAVRQGPPLFHNLQAAVQDQPLIPFRPQKQYLNIIDTGGGSAIASRGPFTVESKLMRAWKDRIDRTFMGLFSDFPEMAPARQQVTPRSGLPDAAIPAMYCAGCGSKVGSDVLTQTWQRLQTTESANAVNPGNVPKSIVLGLNALDDAAVVKVPAGKLMVHTVDFFRALVNDPFVFAQIVVKHCLNDLYAMGATPHTALAIATLPHAVADKQAETLFHLLSGVQKALLHTQTALVGGHTTEGAELALGLACNGLVSPEAILRKQGMQVGDALILTQPLGTGTLFAADMRKVAKGRWIENAISHMIQPSEAAIRCFQQHGVTACTDITGFGLLGHLLEMIQASRVAVALDLQNLPVLFGAQETLQRGIVSSLQAQNGQAARALKNATSYAHHPDYPILFDPQTAGGLLASVPGDRAADCVTQLRVLGYTTSTCIGEVVALAGPEPPVTIRKW
ncbi:MAG: selenide, water dikinase SelD [Leptolyngbya sp. SIO1E4]|nr:selenide, water dikinase SelD [Leptolyngbya sp. SIO1E4]